MSVLVVGCICMQEYYNVSASLLDDAGIIRREGKAAHISLGHLVFLE